MKCKRSLYTSAAITALLLGANGASAQDAQTMETVVVSGVRGAEMKAIDIKRTSASIVDSIAAEDIGKLPDATISDSLQRIPGVQIDRSAGEGSSVNIRGLPQVGTLLNGEAFLTTGNIVGVQPNFTDIPASLFAGADVVKSTTANLLNSGITGTINLKTRRPQDMKEGWSATGAVDATYGDKSHRIEPEYNGLIGYNGGKWGIIASASYSNVTLENSTDGMDQYGGSIVGLDSGSATSWNGVIPSWNIGKPGFPAAFPSDVKVNTPAACNGGNFAAASYAATGCDVTLGAYSGNKAFYNSENFTVIDRLMKRNRLGFNTSLQAELGDGFSMAADFFYTQQTQHQLQNGYQLNSANWLGATFVPITTRDTGVKITKNDQWSGNGDEFYTTQVYKKYLGDMETYSENDATTDTSRNYNFQVNYDNGGNFTGDVRAIFADAHELLLQSYVQFTFANADQWNQQSGAPLGTYPFPADHGGTRVFNALGTFPNMEFATVDMTGDHLGITLDPTLAADTTNKNAYALKTISGEGDHERSSSMSVLRADGHYTFGESGIHFDFGVRESQRSADNVNFNLNAPVYGGDGAYTPDPANPGQWLASSTGCGVRWKAADVQLSDSTCSAGVPIVNGSGKVTGFSQYYVANYYSGNTPTTAPSVISSNIQQYKNLGGVKGISIYNLNPAAMNNVMAFQNALFPGNYRNVDPGGTWHVTLNQTMGYLQGSVDGNVVVPFSFNAGLRIVQTNLGVTQHAVGNALPYGQLAADNGTTRTTRSFTDALPAANLSVDVLDNLKVRLAYAKNMEMLNLDQWGGGLTLNYGIQTGSNIFAVLGGNSSGNPALNPWRSANYDVSVEYYLGKSSMISFAAFYIDVASFITNGSVIRTDLPDQDGVVRGRSVAVSSPIQGAGANLKGMEFGWKQGFDFLPSIFANMGSELNFTYSPSNTGTDLAGNKIPFQDNSAEQANMILWYQDDQLQARIAGNYRSKRAVNQNFGGINGMEEYQAPTFYLDASASYDFTPNYQLFIQGQNLLNQEEHYYLVYKDQKANTTSFEPRYTVGLRARF